MAIYAVPVPELPNKSYIVQEGFSAAFFAATLHAASVGACVMGAVALECGMCLACHIYVVGSREAKPEKVTEEFSGELYIFKSRLCMSY